MSFVKNFCLYCSCYEIPLNYSIWTATGLLGAALNRRIFLRRGDLIHHGNMYICLVGAPGNKKSTCNDWARDWFRETYPDIPISSSVQTREQIVEGMAGSLKTYKYTDHENTQVEFSPWMGFINEFENFLSYNPAGMASFLCDIYDRHKFFDSGTIKRGLENITNPAVNIIACCPPSWLVNMLRGHILTAGICRRMVFVYEESAKDSTGKLIKKAIPVITPEAHEAKQSCLTQLKELSLFAREYQWSPDGQREFILWYDDHKERAVKEADPFLQGFKSSLDVLLLKTAMLLDASSGNPQCLITPNLIEMALAQLEVVMPNMMKLSISAGRNPLIGPQLDLLEYINKEGDGVMLEKKVRAHDKDLSGFEMDNTLRHLKESGRLFEVKDDKSIPGTNPPVFRRYLATEQGIAKFKKTGIITERKPTPPAAPPAV